MIARGTRIGAYEVVGSLGAGGMGEVYRARDPRLNRDVAIKILPDALAGDPDRVARFSREAQTLAALNHPHIAQIYGVEEMDVKGGAGPPATGLPTTSTRALVMELVEGETLADSIARGPIPLDDALPIARQIAEALEAAHDAGVIHRDLKPANIKVRDDGTVKVLDFGLAKALDPAATSSADALHSPTMTARATQMGLVLGTAAYMAPEQAKGKRVDRRADIWAFGAVLYEMLSGKRPFDGDDVSDTLAAVLRKQVEWSTLPATTPPALKHLLQRCLERDVRLRLRDIGEARIALENPKASTVVTANASSDDRRLDRSRPLWQRVAPVAATALVAVAVAGAAVWYVKPSAAPVVTRFRFGLPAGAKFTSVARHVLNISADGTKIVFVANNRLYVRKISEVEPQAIAASENIGSAVVAPAFSPDGRSIAFWSSGPEPSIKRLDIDGGVVMTLCPSDNPFGISWTDDGIVFTLAEKGEILRVSPTGGMPEVIAKSKAGEMISGPQLLPGGRDLLFSVTNETGPDRWDKGRIVVQRVGSTEQRTLIDGGSDARYLASGHLAYALAGVVFAVPFDLSRVALKGTAVPMVVGVRRSVPVAAGAAHFAVSRNGTLVYLPGPSTSLAQMLDLGLASRDGQVKLLDLPRGAYSHPRVSRDGRRIAFLVGSNREEFIAIYNLAGSGAMRRLTLAGNSRYPVWSGDGQRVVYQSDREGDQALYWQPADGSGAPERLTRPAAGEAHFPEHWSPTSNTLLFTIVKGAEHTVWTLTIPDRKIAPIAAIRSSIPINPVFSPDGQWIAYQSDQSGRSAVYVRSSSGAVYPLLPRGADQPHEPLWSPSGTELFYNPRASGFEVVSVTTEPEFAFGNPIGVNRPFNLAPPQARRSYDITPDGWFVALLAPSNETTDGGDFEVVTNWFQELRQRVP